MGIKTKIKSEIKNRLRAILGLQKIEEEIYTLQYFLNLYADIENVPKAEGNLRQLQICDTKLLEVIDAIFQKYSLTYFLSFGTLLGG